MSWYGTPDTKPKELIETVKEEKILLYVPDHVKLQKPENKLGFDPQRTQ